MFGYFLARAFSLSNPNTIALKQMEPMAGDNQELTNYSYSNIFTFGSLRATLKKKTLLFETKFIHAFTQSTEILDLKFPVVRLACVGGEYVCYMTFRSSQSLTVLTPLTLTNES